jgi:folate-binding protein YgfZ
MDIIHWQGLKLILPQDILEQTKNSLSKVAMLSRVSVGEEIELLAYGFYLQNPEDIVPHSLFLPKDLYAKAEGEHCCYYHLGNGFYIFVVEKSAADELMHPFSERNQLLGSLTWHTLRLHKHELSIYPESRGMFLPHRLDLHKTQYLNFDKGCYKGQEIIARTHYKATLKHELRTYIINSQHELFSGQKLFKVDANIEIGELIDYTYLDDHKYLIAVSILKNAPLEVRLEDAEAITHLMVD